MNKNKVGSNETLIIDMKTKQVIVVIKEYADKYRGKMMAQVAHASIGALLSAFKIEECKFMQGGIAEEGQDHFRYSLEFTKNSVFDDWLNGSFTKVVLYVETEKELLDLVDKLNDETCFPFPPPYALITDNGQTVFHGKKTITCLGIGPYISEKIDEITGHLKVLK